MLAMCRFSVQGELKSTVTKNLHSLKAMWSTAVNPCKQECIILLIDAVTPFLQSLADAPSSYMVHDLGGARAYICSPSLVPDRLQDSQRETRRAIFGFGRSLYGNS